MNIINSDIVSKDHDVFWEGTSSFKKDMQPRPVLVITNNMQEGSDEKAQLMKMLDAAKLTADQYNLLELYNGQQVAWHSLREALMPRVVFLIGIAPVSLGVSALFRMNEANNFGGAIWLPTYPIAELEQRADVKKQLWLEGMRPIFIDKRFGDLTTIQTT